MTCHLAANNRRDLFPYWSQNCIMFKVILMTPPEMLLVNFHLRLATQLIQARLQIPTYGLNAAQLVEPSGLSLTKWWDDSHIGWSLLLLIAIPSSSTNLGAMDLNMFMLTYQKLRKGRRSHHRESFPWKDGQWCHNSTCGWHVLCGRPGFFYRNIVILIRKGFQRGFEDTNDVLFVGQRVCWKIEYPTCSIQVDQERAI